MVLQPILSWHGRVLGNLAHIFLWKASRKWLKTVDLNTLDMLMLNNHLEHKMGRETFRWSLMRSSPYKVTVSTIFGVLVFLIELIPPPTSRFLQVFTALFITIAALTIHKPGGATYTCLIAGLIDAFYTGLPIALVLFAVRGGTFDLALSALRTRDSPAPIKVATPSVLSSVITGFAAYLTIVEWLKITVMPFEVFTLFIAVSAILSGIGAIIGVKLWQRLPVKALK